MKGRETDAKTKLYVSKNVTRFFTNLAIIIKCKSPILIVCVIGPNFVKLYKSIIFSIRQWYIVSVHYIM